MGALRNILTKQETPGALLLLGLLGTTAPLFAMKLRGLSLTLWVFLVWATALLLQILRTAWLEKEAE